MQPITVNDDELARLSEARKTKKYGNLLSWKELYLFQQTIASPSQFYEIAQWAKNKNRGEKILLPLKLNGEQMSNLL